MHEDEVTRPSEMYVHIRTTRRYIPEDGNIRVFLGISKFHTTDREALSHLVGFAVLRAVPQFRRT
jgi:hypothetical protein